MESVEAVREKGNGWEPRIGQIKPQTKDFLSPHEISMAQLHTHTPVSYYPTADRLQQKLLASISFYKLRKDMKTFCYGSFRRRFIFS